MRASDMSRPATGALWPLILITSLFFFWGMANNLNDVLIPQFKKAFSLTDLQSGLVQSAFYMGYFLLAIPAGLFMRRFGYKAAVIAGLLLFAAGAFLFYPAADNHQYSWFLGALFVIASGLAFLETSANPLITVLGPPEKAAFRLNLAQAFNPLGSLTGIWVGKEYILSGVEHNESSLSALSDQARLAFYISESQAVQGPYLIIGAIIIAWAVLVALSKFPAAATENTHEHTGETVSAGRSLSGLFAKPHFLFGVMAQFFYVGAQVGIWSYMIRYAQSELAMPEKEAANFLFIALILFAVGRFVGTALMSRLSPLRILAVFAIINIGLCAYAAAVGGLYGLYALTATSFFMSIMFPTIFATAVDGLGPLTKTGSSLLVMSIVSGALLPPLMGLISDASHIRTSIFIPALCFAVIAWYGLKSPKRPLSATPVATTH
ncbi:L-fucose:H+ symporter permease [Asticcacaulis endophyticus]|uniref:L-fucose:H+ symporter permease n=1 Tax=Asticcacaulis endophyticus TaxID=1395890 RepID=A0A918Q136_9CAUL|nr:L-fucose:H+ symporter permease [Asticcacaulis endophyticus]GGZ28179.1 L-fucose:H+ symporter permease [Asticcacaulis endophyticus]